jgi:hypothetical protein
MISLNGSDLPGGKRPGSAIDGDRCFDGESGDAWQVDPSFSAALMPGRARLRKKTKSRFVFPLKQSHELEFANLIFFVILGQSDKIRRSIS